MRKDMKKRKLSTVRLPPTRDWEKASDEGQQNLHSPNPYTKCPHCHGAQVIQFTLLAWNTESEPNRRVPRTWVARCILRTPVLAGEPVAVGWKVRGGENS